MPKALTDEGGDAEKVEVKLPRGLKGLLKQFLGPGETISSVTRQLYVDEITRRAALTPYKTKASKKGRK